MLAKLTPRTDISRKSVNSAIFERFSDKCTLFLKRTIGPWKHLAENLSQGIIKIAEEQNPGGVIVMFRITFTSL